jgi:hypothetical protein
MQAHQYLLAFAAAYIPGEALALWIFSIIRQKFAATGTKRSVAIGKGLLERGVLLLGLASGQQSVITFFGAIKLGTRLKDANQDRISNDYFLIGNIASVGIAIAEYLLYNYFCSQF